MMLGHVGITYGTHFCMGMPMMSELMIGHEPMDCGMGSMDQPVHDKEGLNLSVPDCCNDRYIGIESDEAFSKSISPEIGNLALGVPTAPFLYTVASRVLSDEPRPLDTSPPLPQRDITILHQVFRI